MNNPFRKVLDTDMETHRLVLPFLGQPLKNIIICYDVALTDLETAYLFEQYREVHPELCEEKGDDTYEKAMEFLGEFYKEKK